MHMWAQAYTQLNCVLYSQNDEFLEEWRNEGIYEEGHKRQRGCGVGI